MRILHIIHTLSPETGGPPVVMRQFARAFTEAGHSSEIVCLDHPEEQFLADFPCKVHAIGQCYFGSYAYSPIFRRWLKANVDRFDSLVMHGIWNHMAITVHQEARRAGKLYGVFPHGALDPWFDRQYPLKRLKKNMYWPVLYPVLRDAQAVFFTAESEAELAKTTRRPNMWNSVVAPLGLLDPDGDGVRADEQLRSYYESFPETCCRRLLLFLARIHTKKGCDLLIDAFAQVAQSAPDVDLVIAGPDQEGMQADLQLRAKQSGLNGRVHWPGMLHGDLKWGALRACEALVLPSHQENFGLGIVEALAVSKPVLVSNKVNICGDIDEERVGFVDEDTVEGTLRMLRRWLALTAEDRIEMSARSRQAFLRRFTMSQTVNTIIGALTSTGFSTLHDSGGSRDMKSAKAL